MQRLLTQVAIGPNDEIDTLRTEQLVKLFGRILCEIFGQCVGNFGMIGLEGFNGLCIEVDCRMALETGPLETKGKSTAPREEVDVG